MTNTKPVRTDNAIDEIAFVLQFKSFFSGDQFVKDLIDLHIELKEGLPKYDITNGVMFQVGAQQGQNIQPDKQIGIVCFKRSETDPNRHEWALRVEANRIAVTCSEYKSWNEVSTKAKSYLRAALGKVNLKDNPIVEVVYQCVDKFTCEHQNITFDELFDGGSELLTTHITREMPEAWHIHQGWFEALDKVSARMLHNLNINMHHKQFVNNGIPNQEQVHEAIVSHLIRIQNTESLELKSEGDVLGKDSEDGYLENVLECAHTANKNVIKKLLAKNMLETIGLQDE
ncbi:hypothetical protein [Saccharophagus degradans]|uniref:TIGR04255 family protein n=1 Tax=Saccharophagus degradans TaxID=86304 RepID=A0AAW7X5F3_9GAMM|nr:hypothetical protein [Saccharophagus degradans]MDO6422883.1 hypothetical protein [Saccharophagus degradans]MDO6609304.1 hypothetical protein [Saccharophagus degradans]